MTSKVLEVDVKVTEVSCNPNPKKKKLKDLPGLWIAEGRDGEEYFISSEGFRFPDGKD